MSFTGYFAKDVLSTPVPLGVRDRGSTPLERQIILNAERFGLSSGGGLYELRQIGLLRDGGWSLSSRFRMLLPVLRQDRFLADNEMFFARTVGIHLVMSGIPYMALFSLLMAFRVLHTGDTLAIMPVGGGGLILTAGYTDQMRPPLRKSGDVSDTILLGVPLVIVNGGVFRPL